MMSWLQYCQRWRGLRSTTVMAIEGGPDMTTVDGRSTVGVDSVPIDGFALVAAPLPGLHGPFGEGRATPPCSEQHVLVLLPHTLSGRGFVWQ